MGDLPGCMKRRYFLLGFMGCGKSYNGRLLSQSLGIRFIDLDDWIEERSGTSIKEIFETCGEDHFRALESAVLRDTEKIAEAVIACGGGTPCYGDNMAWMNSHGITVYLRASVDLLVERLISETAHRPLLKGLDREGLQRFIGGKLSEREPCYGQASVIVDLEISGADIVKELAGRFPSTKR